MEATQLVCSNCERPIGRLEQPAEWGDNIVCPECFRRLSAGRRAAVPSVKPVARTIPTWLSVCLLVVLVPAVLVVGSDKFMGAWSILIFAAIVVFIGFAPYLIARRRGHPNATAIGVLCLFGWTGILWIVALVWSVMAIREQQQG